MFIFILLHVFSIYRTPKKWSNTWKTTSTHLLNMLLFTFNHQNSVYLIWCDMSHRYCNGVACLWKGGNRVEICTATLGVVTLMIILSHAVFPGNQWLHRHSHSSCCNLVHEQINHSIGWMVLTKSAVAGCIKSLSSVSSNKTDSYLWSHLFWICAHMIKIWQSRHKSDSCNVLNI